MKIIPASVQIISPIDADAMLQQIERCGRVCYQSEATEGSAADFVRMLIKRGHESVLEHASFTAEFVVDRGVSHEIVRHRLASYSQESTRYCNYSSDKFGSEITVIEPIGVARCSSAWHLWHSSCEYAEDTYLQMLEAGCSPQMARSVLPHSLKTTVVMTANLREWRHFFRLRTAPAAHPQMREVAQRLLEQVRERIPVVFEDI